MPIAKTGSRAKFKHERIKSPKAFDPRSFRTKRAGASRIIVGCPKGKYSPSTGRCKVGMRAQAMLRPKRKNQLLSAKDKNRLRKKQDKILKYVARRGYPKSERLFMDANVTANDLEKYIHPQYEWVFDQFIEEYGLKRNPCGTRNKPSTSTLSWQTWADKQEKQMRKDIDHFIEQGMNKKQVVELVLGGSTIGKPYKDRIRRDYGVNPRKSPPRKKWYYGPSVTHRGKVLVFPSSRTPTQGTHGKKVKYAVGPFKTSEEASKKARYMEMSATGR